MTLKQTYSVTQINNAKNILDKLRTAVTPEYIGLISSEGHSIISEASPGFVDSEVLASLVAGSFAATRQMAKLVCDGEFTMMFHEGDRLIIHIAQISDKVLLVLCFRTVADIGKVRLITRRAIKALAYALTDGGASH